MENTLRTESEYFNECFAITVKNELVWRARPAFHFANDIEKRDEFNAQNAGRAIAKVSHLNDHETVNVDGRNIPVKYAVHKMLNIED
jgi:hypothetical protein